MIRFSMIAIFTLSLFHATARGGEPGVSPAAADSVKLQHGPSVNRDTTGGGNEILLDDIQIQGEVEKPSVIILPKRIEPEMEDDALDRSFSNEINKSAGEVQTPDKAISRVEPVKSIKKELEKKRK